MCYAFCRYCIASSGRNTILKKIPSRIHFYLSWIFRHGERSLLNLSITGVQNTFAY